MAGSVIPIQEDDDQMEMQARNTFTGSKKESKGDSKMTKEEAQHIMEQVKPSYTEKQRVIRGLNILAKYDDDLSIAFEHDQMYTGDFETLIAHMTPEDLQELTLCGWFESQDSWSHF